MKIGLIKWFYQGKSLRTECEDALSKVCLSEWDEKKHLKSKIAEVYKKLDFNWCFKDCKESAIKSTLKQIIREYKTVAIAHHLTNNNATNIELACDYLSEEEKKIVDENSTSFKECLEKNDLIVNGRVASNPTANKHFAKTAKKIMTMFEEKRPNKLKNDLFAKLSDEEKNLIIEAASTTEPGALFTKELLESFAGSCILEGETHKFKFSHFQRGAINQLAENLGVNSEAPIKKVLELQEKTKKNPKALSCFSKSEIQLMNLLFNADLPTEAKEERKHSSLYAFCVLY